MDLIYYSNTQQVLPLAMSYLNAGVVIEQGKFLPDTTNEWALKRLNPVLFEYVLCTGMDTQIKDMAKCTLVQVGYKQPPRYFRVQICLIIYSIIYIQNCWRQDVAHYITHTCYTVKLYIAPSKTRQLSHVCFSINKKTFAHPITLRQKTSEPVQHRIEISERQALHEGEEAWGVPT